jgi:hypothetical protein
MFRRLSLLLRIHFSLPRSPLSFCPPATRVGLLLLCLLLSLAGCRTEPAPDPLSDDDDSTGTDDDDSAAPDDDDTLLTDDDDSAVTDDDDSAAPDDDDSADAPSLGELCFSEIFDPAVPGPDYDQFGPTPGSHCLGTDHQNIAAVERVVFLGDSVTVGSPPSLDEEFYRTQLTESLAVEFGLTVPPPPVLGLFGWPGVNWFDGMAWEGNEHFNSCAKWGARVDDLAADNTQIADCIPVAERSKQHLVVMTVGGNDIASLTQHGAEGVSTAELWQQVDAWVQDFEDSIAMLTDPVEFPVRPFVIVSNNFEFTDGTGDVNSCAAAGLSDFSGDQWEDPSAQWAMIIHVMEQYMRVAVQYEIDMIFMLEHFCGHGYRRDDPAGACYRGPDAELWFDLTCIHPNPVGHSEIANMFLAVVQE